MTQQERKALQAAKDDGWMLHPGSFATAHRYYVKEGEQQREDDLVDLYGPTDKQILRAQCACCGIGCHRCGG